MRIRTGPSWFPWLVLVFALVPGVAAAVELAPGDIVLFSVGSSSGIYRLDPVTLVPTYVSDGMGFGSGTHHVMVDRRGRLFVTDEARGIVEVSPATGERSVFASVESLGGPPRGIGREADGDILVTLQSSPPRLVRIGADGGTPTIVSEGGLLIAPTGVTVTPDGTILVADQNATVNPTTQQPSVGALVRVEPGTGAQSLVAADPLFYFPQELACAGGDSVWIVNRGRGLRSVGGDLTITRLSDGVTTESPVYAPNSQSVALLANGRVVYSGCTPVHGDCAYEFVATYGGEAGLSGYMGTLAAVPEREAPRALRLEPAAPNPFATSTALRFSLTRSGSVQLAVYSVDGRRVRTLVSGTLPAGVHSVTWDGTGAGGQAVRAGVYYARLVSAEGRFARTLVLIR